jgi:hypothetical protein
MVVYPVGEPVHIKDILKRVFADIQHRYITRTRSRFAARQLEGRDMLMHLRHQIKERGIRRKSSSVMSHDRS